MQELVVRMENLTKRYGDLVAVHGLNLEVFPGEILALLGPNGAGKTTTIRMLMGILQPTAGTASVQGLDCFSDRAEVMRRVGYLPDDPIFYDYLRGREIIRFVGEMHAWPSCTRGSWPRWGVWPSSAPNCRPRAPWRRSSFP